MKRFFSLTIFAAIMVMMAKANPVDVATAKKAAETYLNAKKAGHSELALTSLKGRAQYDNLYLFKGKDCFVLMSADDRVKPILAYSTENNFEERTMPEGVEAWIENYNNEVAYAVEHRLAADSKTAEEWSLLKSGKPLPQGEEKGVNRMLRTTWGQGYPYNNACPDNCLTGCVATAMAQVMNFWEKPTQGNGSHTYNDGYYQLTANFGATTYDWDNMLDDYLGNATQAQIDAVATLMFHCGVSVNMTYGQSASSASTSNAPAALHDYFDYTQTTYASRANNSDNWVNLLKNDLDRGRPIIYSGRSTQSGGHAFVCDGYTDDGQFHFNWGWGGLYNGNFSIDALNPGTNDFNDEQCIVYQLKPRSLSNLPAPTNVRASVDGRKVTIRFDAVEGATKYYVYHGETGYYTVTSTAVAINGMSYGQHSFYVRAVDSDNQLSERSNTVTVEVVFTGMDPTNLTATVENSNVNLSWTAPQLTGNDTLYYMWSASSFGRVGTGAASEFKWGQRYPQSAIENYAGKAITKIQLLVSSSAPGAYYLNVATGDADGPQDYLIENARYTLTPSSSSWYNLVLSKPIILDYTKDLWVTFRTADITYPACYYQATDLADAFYRFNGVKWVEDQSRCACIRVYIGDDSDSHYLVYRDGVLYDSIQESQYRDRGLEEGYHEYYVTNKYFAHETVPSNTVTATIGSGNYFYKDGNWDVASNWSRKTVPSTSATDSVVIDAHLIVNTNAYAKKAVIHEGKTVVVNKGKKLFVSSGLTNLADSTAIVLEDGAQLIHTNSGIQAIVRKEIEPITIKEHAGWYLIAPPIGYVNMPASGSHIRGLINGEIGEGLNTYDLYSYNESSAYWTNYESQDAGFLLSTGQGYLYANEEPTTVEFRGLLRPATQRRVAANLSHSNSILNGFNLVGNPFVCNAVIANNVPYYILNEDRTDIELAASNRQIPPCEGVFVKATAEQDSVIFQWYNYQGKGETLQDDSSFDIQLSCSGKELDRARVCFGRGNDLEKLQLSNTGAHIHFVKDAENYSLVYADETVALPLVFKSDKDGEYTLCFQGCENLKSLVLVNPLTGESIDVMNLNAETRQEAEDGCYRYTFFYKSLDGTVQFVVKAE